MKQIQCNKNYKLIDLLKFLCAYFVIVIHTRPFQSINILLDESNKWIVVNVIKASFSFSCMIEICQLFLRLGTFQLSDIFQNTLGGFIGATIYIIRQKMKGREKLR